ncbi:magnesium transporter NIPA-domain-containing protein [Elsinoe ampelina]|uniref:Magnesium transporter NIPA-domain-containing protein n=1 Tax=Elsinoe ampelina TaxID=302913 RepID=A0A6A6GN93_9PEZI|nr:magnesium transporter NIPA-domain-containing protein [Elsinoe ampelina]
MASLSPGAVVAIGVVVGLISTCVQSIGLTLQRKSHILEEEKAEHLPKRAPYRRRRWQIGMLLFLLSNIVGSSIQITTLPLPLLSTLQASGLVFNALLASLLLHEPFTRRTLLGTLLVATGALLISFFSALPEPSHTLSQLLALLVLPAFLTWMSLTLLLVVAILVLNFLSTRLLPPHRLRTPRARLFRGMSYGFVSGILSAHALLLAKSAVELLVRTIVDKKNQFGEYQSWLLILLFLFLALTQLYYLHHGLRLVSTSILYPFVFCIYNIIAILDGLIYFRQMDRLAPLSGGLIALGTVVLLTGVLALSWRLSDETSNEDDSDKGIKADLPHSALTPGLGLVDEEINDVHTPLRSYFDHPEEHYRDDPSDSETTFPDLTNSPTTKTNEDASERDPLLSQRPRSRTSNTPSQQRRRSSARREAAMQRRRRSTIKEVQTIWDELRDERNWFPPTTNQRSPRLTNPDRYRDEESTLALAPDSESTSNASPAPTARRVAWDDNHDAPTTANPSANATPTRNPRTVEERRARFTGREKRRTAPPGTYTFENVLSSLRSSGPGGRGVKRTVSWGQGSQGTSASLGAPGGHGAAEDGSRPLSAGLLIPGLSPPRSGGKSEGREREGGAAGSGNAGSSGGGGGAWTGRGERERVRVPSVERGNSLSEEERRKSWTGSVKLDWWRKKRREGGGEGGAGGT